jgi:hypothetical protein
MTITLEDLVAADSFLTATEKDLGKVFSRIGRSEDSLQADRFISFVKRHGQVGYEKAYQHIHSYFPDFRDFEGMLDGTIRSGLIKLNFVGVPRMGPDGKPIQDAVLTYTGP